MPREGRADAPWRQPGLVAKRNASRWKADGAPTRTRAFPGSQGSRQMRRGLLYCAPFKNPHERLGVSEKGMQMSSAIFG